MLPPEDQVEILRLHFSEGLSQRQIAKQLGVNRKTVNAVIKRRQVLVSTADRSSRRSILEPYYSKIDELLEKAPGRSGVNIMQRLRDDGYQGGITILRDHLRVVRPDTDTVPQKQAFFELSFSPGEAGQVDWGEFGDVFGNGTKVHVFVMVLCFSRMLYIEFTLRETLQALLRCYERALRFFGGRCKEYWHDNMPTVVAERVGRLKRFTDGFLAYAGWHGFMPILCNKGAPHEKGRVEDAVKLVRNQFWPGRSFTDLDDLNGQARTWLDKFANRREHETTKQIPELVFEKERSCMLPLRPEPYDTDEIASPRVNKFHKVHFDHNNYTVPWTLVGKTVTVRANDTHVSVFYGKPQVARHQRCYQRGKDIVDERHAEGLKEIKPGAQRAWQVQAVESFGPNCRRYLEFIEAGTRSLRAELRELLCLATVYGAEQLEQAIGELLSQGLVGAARIERLLRLSEAAPQAPEPLTFKDERLQFVPPTPQLCSYDTTLLDALRDDEPEPADDEPQYNPQQEPKP
jgi:transposase